MSSTADNQKTDQKWCASSSSKFSDSSGDKPQDADYSVPCLSDELETTVLARFPLSEYWKLSMLNKHYLTLLKSGEIYKIRKQIGIKDPCVFTFTMGESNWWVFENHFMSGRMLPVIPGDFSFEFGDKESFCAGKNLFVCGKEIEGVVIWRYDLDTNQWFRGPSMIVPRCLFASATRANLVYIAGGMAQKTFNEQEVWEISDSAEKYNSETKSWEALPKMVKKRRLCSGCFLDNKFYVIGGQGWDNNFLRCGEFYDEKTNTWTLIPDMLNDIVPMTTSYSSPPLIAVANNYLYALDCPSNQMKVYLKGKNTWKSLGQVPVKADAQRGWGVAFKSLGNELLVIGATSVFHLRQRMSIYTCCPDPDAVGLKWRRIECGNQLSDFVHNCAVMQP